MKPSRSSRLNRSLALFIAIGVAIYQALFLSTQPFDFYLPLFVFCFMLLTLSVFSWTAKKGEK